MNGPTGVLACVPPRSSAGAATRPVQRCRPRPGWLLVLLPLVANAGLPAAAEVSDASSSSNAAGSVAEQGASTGREQAEGELPAGMRSTRIVFLGTFFNAAEEARAKVGGLDPGDLQDLEPRTRTLLERRTDWELADDASFHGDAASAGRVLFAAVVLSRAEVTRTRYAELGITRHTAWVTVSLELFNARTRAVHYSELRTGYKPYETGKKELEAEARRKLLRKASRELIRRVVEGAGDEFDPDFVLGELSDEQGERQYRMTLDETARVARGQLFHTLGSECGEAEDEDAARPCRLRVVAIEEDDVVLRARRDSALEAGTRVFTIANKRAPPDVRPFRVAGLKLGETASSKLDGMQRYLLLQLHGRLAERGTLRMVSPVDVVWSERAKKRLRKQGIVATSELALELERVRPAYSIRAAVAHVEERTTRTSDVEDETGYVAVALAQLRELGWSDGAEPEIVERRKVGELMKEKGLLLARELKGKKTDESKHYLSAAQNALGELAEAVTARGAELMRRGADGEDAGSAEAANEQGEP